jgi:hypothetical protein
MNAKSIAEILQLSSAYNITFSHIYIDKGEPNSGSLVGIIGYKVIYEDSQAIIYSVDDHV